MAPAGDAAEAEPGFRHEGRWRRALRRTGLDAWPRLRSPPAGDTSLAGPGSVTGDARLRRDVSCAHRYAILGELALVARTAGSVLRRGGR